MIVPLIASVIAITVAYRYLRWAWTPAAPATSEKE